MNSRQMLPDRPVAMPRPLQWGTIRQSPFVHAQWHDVGTGLGTTVTHSIDPSPNNTSPAGGTQ